MKIAVIGSGISGLSAAWALRDAHEVTLFEAESRLGGHSCTVEAPGANGPIPVDVGFIVFNHLNYPNLTPMFAHLGVETIASDMSFAVSDPNGFEWSSNKGGLFAWKRNLFNPRYLRFLTEIVRFCALARKDAAEGQLRDQRLGDYLDRHRFDATFRSQYLVPMGAAIWSTPEGQMEDYPAESFLRFFDNHRLLHAKRPVWRTVKGGSRTYVARLAADLGARVRLQTGATAASPLPDGRVRLRLSDGTTDDFDHVIFACHGDQARPILDERYEDQRLMLGSVRFSKNAVYLHSDPALMPKRKAAWAAWNLMKTDGQDVCVSYWMNTLQALDTDQPMLVTLNPPRPPDPSLTHGHWSFDHPMFDTVALAAQRSLKRIQGQDGLWFAGAWLGNGFHEDGLKSGLACALALGGSVPWTAVDVPAYPVPTAQKAVNANLKVAKS
jgi:uncharacterized protein